MICDDAQDARWMDGGKTTMGMISSDNPCPMVNAFYGEDGKISSLSICWRKEMIVIIPDPKNAPTREFQRADEVVQGLMNQFYGR